MQGREEESRELEGARLEARDAKRAADQARTALAVPRAPAHTLGMTSDPTHARRDTPGTPNPNTLETRNLYIPCMRNPNKPEPQ